MASRLAALNGWGLNLGCGGCPETGYVNVDRTKHSKWVDEEWDLEQEDWPVLFEDVDSGEYLGRLTTPASSSHRIESIQFARVKCKDVLEHIRPDLFFQVLNNIWSLTRPEGILEIQVPEWGSEWATADPTHWRGLSLSSFDILDPSTTLGRKNRFYGNKPWTILNKNRVPRSNVNLAFTLQKPK